MPIETFNQAESTGDAQNTQARGYELTFVENKKFVNSKFGAPLFFIRYNIRVMVCVCFLLFSCVSVILLVLVCVCALLVILVCVCSQ